jgi:hypothetical protein
MDAIDLTDPSTSIGPRRSSALSDLMLFFFLTATDDDCWADVEDEPPALEVVPLVV